MAKYAASYDFPQDPDSIYGILSDVERMNEFMPLCKRSQVVSRHTSAEAEAVGVNFLLRYRQIGFEVDFDGLMTLWPAERRVKFETTEATFGSGYSQCTVTGAGRTGSRVLFEADCKIKGLFVRIVFGRRLLRQGMDRIMDRVRQRAETLAAL
jgi:ribosome-associated toxin RatA of RatAB toxin-antitoxin module